MMNFRRSIAVVIGIDGYGRGVPPLKTAVHDAEKLGQVLEKVHGYEVWLRVNEAATADKLRDLLTLELPAAVGPDDRVIFYFAGHGVATDSDDGPAGYLLPQDAQREDDGTFLQMVKLHEHLSALSCRHLLVILDCCFSGAFRWSSTRHLQPIPRVLYQERFARYVADPAWQVITSAASDQLAQDKRGDGEHSPFAFALLDALAGAADFFPPAERGRPAGDGVITATELYLYLRDRLDSRRDSDGIRQTPGFWPLKKHDKGEFVFLNPRREPELPPAESLTLFNNPYRGLRPYEEKHSQLFFGRRRVEEALHRKVHNDSLTVVIGASGTGKSSVVMAGLIPELRKQDETNWHIPSLVLDGHDAGNNAFTIRPGPEPIQSLLEFVRGDVDLAAIYSTLQSDFQSQPKALAELIRKWCESSPQSKLLLVVDQLEELVTMCRDERKREQFLALLTEAMKAEPERLRVVLTVRSDFEPQFLRSPLAAIWAGARFIIPPMTQDELREAIEGPATARVVYFEPSELVDQLINEVVQMPGALPLLSFTLSEMYIKYIHRGGDNRALTASDYESLGGVVGSLRRRANEEYTKLNDDLHRDTMRRLILRMVSLEGNEIARRHVPRSEFVYSDNLENDRITAVVKQLTEARLLVEGNDPGSEPYIEPAHDALVSGWDLLWQWIQKEQAQQDNLLLQRRLTQAANDWFKGGQKPGQLWDDDPRLPLIEKEITLRKYWLNQLESTFVKLGVQQRKSRRRTRTTWVSAALLVLAATAVFAGVQAVNARASRDEALKQANEAEKQRDEAVKATNKANEATNKANEAKNAEELAKTDALKQAKLAKEAAEEADKQRRTAERQTEVARTQAAIATSRQLAAQSQLVAQQSGRDSNTSALLAVESYLRYPYPNLETDQALRNVLSLMPRRLASFTHSGYGYSGDVRFSPDSKYLISSGEDGTVRFWDSRTGQLETTHPLGAKGELIAFDNQCRRIASVASFPFKDLPLITYNDKKIGVTDLSDDSYQTFSQAGEVKAIALNPEGTLLAGVDGTGVLQLFDVQKHVSIRSASFVAKDVILNNLKFSPDGNYLIVAVNEARTNSKNIAHLLRVPSLVEVGQASHSDIIRDIAFAEDSSKFVTVGRDGKAKVWGMDGSLIVSITHPSEIPDLSSVSFSPNGARIATSSHDFNVWVWDAKTGLNLAHMRHESSVRKVGFDKNGNYVLTVSDDKTARLWSVATGLEVSRMTQRDGLISMAFDPSNFMIAISTAKGEISTWETIGAPKLYHTNNLEQVGPGGLTNDGKVLVTVDGTRAYVTDVDTGKIVLGVTNKETVVDFAFDTLRGLLALVGSKNITVWKIESSIHRAQRVAEFSLERIGGNYRQCIFGEKNSNLAVVSSSETLDIITIWNFESGEILATIKGGYTGAVKFSQTGRFFSVSEHKLDHNIVDPRRARVLSSRLNVYSIDAGGEVAHFDYEGGIGDVALDDRGLVGFILLKGGIVITSLTHTNQEVKPALINAKGEFLQFSRDGKLLVVTSFTRLNLQSEIQHVYLLDTATGEQVAAIREKGTGYIGNFDLNLNHQLFVIKGQNNLANVYELPSGKLKLTLEQSDDVQSVTLSPDGRYVATTSNNNVVRLWDLSTGKVVASIKPSDVSGWTGVGVRFSRDGRYLVTNRYDALHSNPTKIGIWLWRLDDLVEETCRRVSPGSLSPAQWKLFFPGENYRTTCSK